MLAFDHRGARPPRVAVILGRAHALYAVRGIRIALTLLSTRKASPMNKLISALLLGAFALVQVPAYAQAAAAPAASAASAAAKKDDKKAATSAEKPAPKKEKKGGC